MAASPWNSQGHSNTLFYCRENENHRTQDEQPDHHTKDVRKDWEEKLLWWYSPFCLPRRRTLWKGQDCVGRAAVQSLEILEISPVPCQKAALILELISPAPKSWEHTETKVLHLLLYISKGQVFSGGCRNLCRIKSRLLLLNVPLGCSGMMLFLPSHPEVDKSVYETRD